MLDVKNEFESILDDESAWKPGTVVYVDVDDTIMDRHDHPKPSVIEFLHYAKSRGCRLFLWSQAGDDYCKEHAERLGIAHLFQAFLPKPDIAVDDLQITTRFIRAWFHPIQLAGIDWTTSEKR